MNLRPRSRVGRRARVTREGTKAPSAVAATALLLAGCAGGVLDARGPVADADRQMMLNALAIMLGIVVPTIAVALAFA